MLNIIAVTVWAEMLNKLPVDHPLVVGVIVTAVSAFLMFFAGLVLAIFKMVFDMAPRIKSVDKAVNNRGPGDPKLYDLVQSIDEKSKSNERRLTRVEAKVDAIEDDTKKLVCWRDGFTEEDVPIKTGQEARHWVDREAIWKDKTDGRLDDLEREERQAQERLDKLEDKE